MIGIQINTDFLELPAGTSTQVDRNTPLTLGDEILGEYAFPMTLRATYHNMRLLGYINIAGVTINSGKLRLPAKYYENNFFSYEGTLVVEYVQQSQLYPEEGEISIYFLTGISSFYQQAKSVLLKDIDLGGERVFAGSGFISHVESTWLSNANGSDYVFAPIYNPGFMRVDVTKSIEGTTIPEDKQSNFMNKIRYTGVGNTATLAVEPNRYTLVPFLYLKYLLLRIFRHFKFSVEGAILNDPDFIKKFADNYQSINWATIKETFGPGGVRQFGFGVLDEVKFNLQQHVPQDWLVSRFLLQIANRYAFSYQFDINKGTCTIVSLNDLPVAAQRRDMTGAVGASVKRSFSTAAKIYGVKQKFDETDTFISSPDLREYSRGADVMGVENLPAAGPALDNQVVLVYTLNQYYLCKYTEDEPNNYQGYNWVYLADNIYDYEPEGMTDSIETEITTVNQVVYTNWRENSKALFPQVNRPGNYGSAAGGVWIAPETPYRLFSNIPTNTAYTPFGMRILSYHGMRPDTFQEAGGITVNYPFASPHVFDIAGNKLSEMSAAFNGRDAGGQIGLIAKRWTEWLKILASQEKANFMLLLTVYQYNLLRWEDIILLNNIPYLLTRIQIDSPYQVDSQDKGKVVCEGIRIQ